MRCKLQQPERFKEKLCDVNYSSLKETETRLKKIVFTEIRTSDHTELVTSFLMFL